MITIKDLDAGDWQQILLEEVYDKDAKLLKALENSSFAGSSLCSVAVSERLSQIAAEYVDLFNSQREGP